MTWDAVTVATVLGLVTSALGSMWYVFRKVQQIDMNTKRLDALDEKFDTILEELRKIQTTQENVAVALWGVDGQNGLRGELRELREWVHEDIRSRLGADTKGKG